MTGVFFCSIINTDNTVNTDRGDTLIFTGKENVFEQIASNYKKLIETGVLKYGEYLPSCRDLAKELAINPNTVQKAYTLLEEEGYVIKVVKKGVYVSYKKDDINSLDILKEHLKNARSSGVSKEDILNALDDIYGGIENDRD